MTINVFPDIPVFKVTDLFGFLHRLDTADSAEIEEATKKLLQVYPGDLETCLSMNLSSLQNLSNYLLTMLP